MAFKLIANNDATRHGIFLVVVDDATTPPTEHPEFGKVQIVLDDIAFADLAKIGVIQLRNVGNDAGGKPVYLLASGIPLLGGGYGGTYVIGAAYSAGAIVRVESTATVNGITLVPGVYGCILNTSQASPATNSIPQFPEPANPCWQLISLGIQSVNVCSNGAKEIYIQATAPF